MAFGAYIVAYKIEATIYAPNTLIFPATKAKYHILSYHNIK